MVCIDSPILVTKDDLIFSLLAMNDYSATIREIIKYERILPFSVLRFFIPILDFLFVFLYLNDISIPY